MPHQCKTCPVWYGAEDDEYGPCLVKSGRGEVKRITHGEHVCDEVAHIAFADTVLNIRPMTEADLDFALTITDSVGWGYTKEDLANLLRYEPQGNLVATEDGERVGMLTTTAYGNVGWIGNVVTDEAVRGRGFGQALVKAATEYLRGAGVVTVLLFAYEDTVGFYERLGFEVIGESLRMVGNGTADGRRRRGLEDGDLEEILRLDGKAMGYSRERVLRNIWETHRESFFVALGGDGLVGYAVGPRGAGEREIGPWVCEPDEGTACVVLLDEVLGATDDILAVTIPSTNATALDAVEARGFHEHFRVALMATGPPPPWKESMILGVGSLEKG